jgi:signal transduction histidine kinase
MIDETQFRQVIQNLVNNAIKFIDNKNPKILLSLKEKEGKIYINIEDN